MKQYFYVIFRLAYTLTKRFFRDKVAMFFTLVFPLIFLFVFGSLFGKDRGAKFDLAIINQSQSAFTQNFIVDLKKSDFITEKPVTSIDDAKEKMGRGEVDTILLLPPQFGQQSGDNQPPGGQAVVYYDPGNAQTGQTFASILSGILGGVNEQITGQKPLFTVTQQSTGKEGLSSFDYIFSGMLGFTLLSLGFFGLTNSLPSMKKEGILRRLRSTPIRTSQFILGNALNYLAIGITAITVMFMVGITVFKFNMQGDYPSFIALVIMGTILMFGFGLAIAGWAKNENQAAPLAHLVAFPTMFLSGTFFPRFLMPQWLQNAAGLLPLSPIIDGFRFIFTENKTLFDLGPQLLIIGVWTVVIYVLAFRLFRWE